MNKWAKQPKREWGWLSWAIPAAASLLGGERRNNAAEAQSWEQMEFQERMSNTQWARGVRDMRNAGINPMAAYSSGGASSPAGAQANMEDTITPAVNTALAARRADLELENMKAQNSLLLRQADLTAAQRDKEAQLALNAGTESDRIVAQTVNLNQQTTELASRIGVNQQSVEKMIQEVKESYTREDLNKAEAVLKKASAAEAKVIESFFKSDLGEHSPFMKFVMAILSSIRR